jgi:hypothetical protein
LPACTPEGSETMVGYKVYAVDATANEHEQAETLPDRSVLKSSKKEPMRYGHKYSWLVRLIHFGGSWAAPVDIERINTEATGEFFTDPDYDALMIPPREGLQYKGPVVVMVGPACVSACEFFSYAMTINDRATVVGQYPSSGAGGGVEAFMMPEDTYVQMTVTREMDADGNIHIEGSGVEPDVCVPVTVESFQRELAGEDVILEAAEKVISQPKGAGVTPSAPPKFASQEEAENALSGGAAFLEDKAREQYAPEEVSVPGVFTYTVPLAKSETLVWGYFWCTTTTEILDQNFTQIEVKFELNGEAVPLDKFVTADLPSGDTQCRVIYTALSDWKPGEHHLTTAATFKTPINDGMGDYPAGDYISEYSVFVP